MKVEIRWVHLAVHTKDQHLPLHDPAIGGWLWPRLQRAFPLATSSCLMSDHVHLSTGEREHDEARCRLRAILSGMSRSKGPASTVSWYPVDPAHVIADPGKHRRQLRYDHLNPSRAGLVADPLEWVYSTHRDLVGAVAEPWIDVPRLTSLLGRGRHPVAELHTYVSADPSVDVEGTSFPRPAPPSEIPLVPLAAVLAAALACCRAQPHDLRRQGLPRRLFLSLAQHQGWRDAPMLARICGISRQAVSNQRRRPAPRGLAAAALCLGDLRLHQPWLPSVHSYLRELFPSTAVVSSRQLQPGMGRPIPPQT